MGAASRMSNFLLEHNVRLNLVPDRFPAGLDQ